MELPTPDQVEAHLQGLLRRGSVNLGEAPDTERLMLMLTRSCELRCAYCFVQKSETRPAMPMGTALRAVDLLMRSRRSRLELQLFGGEPTRAWEVLERAVTYAHEHPERAGRRLEIVLTTNGIGLTPERVAALERLPVMVLFSLDGDKAAHNRFRGGHLLDDEAAWAAVDAAIDRLKASSVAWFMNATLPPAAAHQLVERYLWARQRGVPRLQLNYAVGMRWSERQTRAYLEGLLETLRHHHAQPEGLQLFNWRSDCEPVMLSDDLIVDTDGAVMHDGAIFLERAFDELKQTYARGHVDELEEFDPLRWDLATLNEVMELTYPPGSEQRAVIRHNIRLGAAVDWCIRRLREELRTA